MKQVDISTFDLEVASGLSVVQFSGSWCNPCKMVKPILTELSEELTNVNFLYVDVDENPELSSRYAVMSLPAILVLRDGELVDTTTGFRSKDYFVEMIEKYL